MEVGRAGTLALQPPGEPGRQQREMVSQENAFGFGKISGGFQMGPPPAGQTRERDPGGHRDIEALREAGHGNAERAAAGGEGLRAGPLMLVAEEEGHGAVGSQLFEVDCAAVKMARPDFEALRLQRIRRIGAARVRVDLEPLVRVLRDAAVGERVLLLVRDDVRLGQSQAFASSSSLKRNKVTTGPKISSRANAISFVTSRTMVGSKKVPPSACRLPSGCAAETAHRPRQAEGRRQSPERGRRT